MRYLLWLVLTTALACGNNTQPDRADGGATDANINGDMVTVRVVDDNIPVAGAKVVFHTPSGEVAGVVVANANGIAEYEIEPGSLVTVAYPNEITLAVSRIQLLTFVDVDPGDQLTVEIPAYPAVLSPPDLGPTIGYIRIELPPIANAGYFTVHLGCMDVNTDQLVTDIEIPEACLGSDGTVDVTVDAFTPPDLSSRSATTFANNIYVAYDVFPTVTLPAWITDLPSIDVVLTDIPDGATNAFAIAVMLANGHAFPPVIADTAALTKATATLSPRFLPAFADLMDLEVRLNADVANITTVFFLGTPVELTTTVSGTGLLPTVRDIVVDANANEISWTATGDLANADATFLFLRSERREGAVTRQRRWTITTPPDRASPFLLPELPPELEAYRPLPGDDYLDPGIVTFDVDWIAGYEAFIVSHGLRFLDDACVPTYTTARLTRTGVFFGPQLSTSTF